MLPPLCRPSVQREYCHHRVAATAAAAAAAASPIFFVGGNVTCGIALSGGILPSSIKYRQVTASPVSPAYLDLHGTNDTTVPYDWEKANGDDSTWGNAVEASAWLTSQRARNYLASIPGAGHVPFEAILRLSRLAARQPSLVVGTTFLFGFLYGELNLAKVPCGAASIPR